MKLVFVKDQVIWLSSIVANVQLYFKLKGYIFPHVETEELYLGRIHFHLLLADRSIPKDYFKLLIVINCTLCLK